MPVRETMTPEEFEHFMADLQSGKLYRQMEESFTTTQQHLVTLGEVIHAILDRVEVISEEDIEAEVLIY